MKLKELEELVRYCQENRDNWRCSLMTDRKGACLMVDLCNQFKDCHIFYWNQIFDMIEDELKSIPLGFIKKKQVLDKYKKLSELCRKSKSGGHGSEYCGNNCGIAVEPCQKYLHRDIGDMETAYVYMEKVYPVVKWILENVDELKNVT